MCRSTDMVYINADDIQRALGCDVRMTAQLAETRREDQRRKKECFCFGLDTAFLIIRMFLYMIDVIRYRLDISWCRIALLYKKSLQIMCPQWI